MANINTKKDTAVDDFISQVASSLGNVEKSIEQQKEVYEKQLNELQESLRKRTLKEIQELEGKGIIKNQEEAQIYAKKRLDENRQEKLRNEIEILNIIKDTTSQHLDELANKKLEKEKEILQANTKEEKKAKLKEWKELNKEEKKTSFEKEKEKAREEGKGYDFGDIFKDNFKNIQLELAKGNNVRRTTEETLLKTMKNVGRAINESLNAVNQAISSYAQYQTSINTRLQGSGKDFSDATKALSEVAFSPLIDSKKLYENLNSLVGEGISTNVEQRAFFETIKDGIATTFDVNSDALRKMIRLQQVDSTAARLGMESYLTKFLNEYVDNTEYLTSTFDNVASSLFQASSMLGKNSSAGASAEFEYIVQKWLGSLTGKGFGEDTANSIASALGQLGSGDVSVLSSEIGQLLTVSANSIGQNIGQILNDGLDADETNKLLSAMVTYLQTIADNGTNVTKSELSKMFGVSMSDLVAVTNFKAEDLAKIESNVLTTQGMFSELTNQFETVGSRLGIANKLENLFGNLTFQQGMGIAANPATYAAWKITDLIQGVTNGISIPAITAFGNGVDLEATVENLIKTGIIGASTIGQTGQIVNGLNSWKDGSKLLDAMKVEKNLNSIQTFGDGLSRKQSKRSSGIVNSEMEYVGSTDSEAYYNSAINTAKSQAQVQLVEQLKETKDPLVEYLSDEVKLPSMLKDIANNQQTFIENYAKGTQAIPSSTNVSTTTSDVAINGQYDKVLADQNTNIVAATTENNNNPNISNYLSEIDFGNGFKELVEDVNKIWQKMNSGSSDTAKTNTGIEGFTQFSKFSY